MAIWMRAGDGADYAEFDAVSEAAEHLRELGCAGPMTRGIRFGVVGGGFHGNNYVSLYWGDADANAIRELTDAELAEFNASL